MESIKKIHIQEAYAIDPEFGLMIWALTVVDDLKRYHPYRHKRARQEII